MKTILAVIGIIEVNNKFLLTKRHEPDRQFHGYWHLPGGGVQDRETPEEAIVREMKEELGVDVTIKSMLPGAFTRYRNNKSWKGVFLGYIVTMNNPKATITLNSEASEYAWFTFEEIKKLKTLPLSEAIILKVMEVK